MTPTIINVIIGAVAGIIGAAVPLIATRRNTEADTVQKLQTAMSDMLDDITRLQTDRAKDIAKWQDERAKDRAIIAQLERRITVLENENGQLIAERDDAREQRDSLKIENAILKNSQAQDSL